MTNSQELSTHSSFCDVSNLEVIRNFLRINLEQNKICEKIQNLIILAVDEICSNSIIHGNNQDSKAQIDVSISYTDENIVIDIKDKGKFFDYSQYKTPTVQELISNRQKGSMGLMLVKKIMEKIEFFRENGINVCRLVKKKLV